MGLAGGGEVGGGASRKRGGWGWGERVASLAGGGCRGWGLTGCRGWRLTGLAGWGRGCRERVIHKCGCGVAGVS